MKQTSTLIAKIIPPFLTGVYPRKHLFKIIDSR